MDENQPMGGAGPALAAHSKDGAAAGQTPASNTLGSQAHGSGVSETVTRLSGQARDAAARVGASVSEAAQSARQSISGQSERAVEQTTEFVRQQPFVAMAITGVACFALGVLLGRR
jgi:ElaB/YqjD/DUF883 family membrane-anchored ribosome-binding protein